MFLVNRLRPVSLSSGLFRDKKSRKDKDSGVRMPV